MMGFWIPFLKIFSSNLISQLKLPLISKNTAHVKIFFVSFFALKNPSPLFKEVIFTKEDYITIFGWNEFIIADTGQNFMVIYSGAETWDLVGMSAEDYLVLRTAKEITYKFYSHYSIRSLVQQGTSPIYLVMLNVSETNTRGGKGHYRNDIQT